MQLEMSVTLDANLSLQCGLSGPTSSMCDSDVLPPRWPAATREELFGVLSHSLQGRFQTLQIPVEAHIVGLKRMRHSKPGKYWF